MGVNELITALATNGIGLVCAAAVLWFAYYRETITIPAMIKTFSDTQTSAQQSFETRNAKVVDSFTALVREERASCERQHAESRDRLDKILAEMKEQRHYLLNLTNVLGLRQAVEKERQRLEDTDSDLGGAKK